MKTFAPLESRLYAIPNPIPEPPPVTRATLSLGCILENVFSFLADFLILP